MKFIVAQIGARRGYAVPAILEEAGMLERFYTDLTGDIGLGAVLAWAAILPFLRKPARRLTGRRLPPAIRNKTTTFGAVTLMHALRQRLLSHTPASNFRQSARYSRALGHAMERKGFGNATHLYSMLDECGPLLNAAKRHGLKIVTEVYIPLSTERILADERRRFPHWETQKPHLEMLRREPGFEDPMLKLTDYFVCPSEVVRQDLVRNWSVEEHRTCLVPYGMNPELLSVHNQAVRGRILFVGTAELRKGIHYFAMAAERLTKMGYRYEFHVAGNVESSVVAQEQSRYVTYLGRVPRGEITNEYATADVFVLPSLAEGGAEAIYEALACALPVITTSEAGSVVRDKIEGRLVAARDPLALADAIVELVEDQQKREQMSRAARQRASEFTWERYGERLIQALDGFGDQDKKVCEQPSL
jgi:glycosyltransferase involved in cell wall biosynthesis